MAPVSARMTIMPMQPKYWPVWVSRTEQIFRMVGRLLCLYDDFIIKGVFEKRQEGVRTFRRFDGRVRFAVSEDSFKKQENCLRS